MSELLLHPKVVGYHELLSRPGVSIVYGPPGVGKTQFVRTVYRADWDRVLITPNEKETITVEMIKELVPKLQFKATGQATAVIIDQAEKITPQAQNAFLKTLEELPANLTVVLITDRLNSLLPTVQSRARSLHMPPPLRAAIEEWLRGRGLDDGAIHQLLASHGPYPASLAAALAEPTSSVATELEQCFAASLYVRLQAARALQSQLPGILGKLLIYVRLQLRRDDVDGPWLEYLSAILAAQQMSQHNLNSRFVLDHIALAGEKRG